MAIPASIGKSWAQAQSSWRALAAILGTMPTIQLGVIANRPAASSSNERLFYYATDEEKLYLSVKGAWKLI